MEDGQRINMQSPLMPNELNETEWLSLKEAQKIVNGRLAKEEYESLSPFCSDDGVLRVGRRVSQAVVPYENKHAA